MAIMVTCLAVGVLFFAGSASAASAGSW